MRTIGRFLPFLVSTVAVGFSLGAASRLDADEKSRTSLAMQLQQLSGQVIRTEADRTPPLSRMLAQDAQDRIRAANLRETSAWQAVKTRADWEAYRDRRLQSLRDSLGQFPPVPKDLKVRVTRRLKGDGFAIDNLVFESRPGLVVTANLYRPADSPKSMPGILICHSHHNPKTQGELQDMGMTWAQLGCLVLVMDQLGHGERRQHPFRDASSYPHSFRPGRQDYYFRYNVALQLHLIGDSLIGWMVWDLMRGVDLLLKQPGIDPERLILLGAVAGGGDPAAVTAALDPRIRAVVPFNFGGPQPETVYPLPAEAERIFNYAGGGSWESTRNLRLSARDGFFPWVIVGSAAPRPLIYAHEFAWSRERDPVWARLGKIYDFYQAGDHLASVHGRGKVSGQPPESTHCNNIGPEHRQMIYPAFQRWFGIPAPAKEYRQRRPSEELLCLTPEAIKEFKPRPVHELAGRTWAERADALHQQLALLNPEERRQRLRNDWARLLGNAEPTAEAKQTARDVQTMAGIVVERIVLEVEPRIVVPLLLLVPERKRDARLPVVVGLSQQGKQAFSKSRSERLAELLAGGAAVCLPDLRGTGETRPGDDRGRASRATALSATELMLGRTMVGLRLRDLRSVLSYLRTRPELEPARIALWGDSFAPVNQPDRPLEVPLDADRLPDQAEPLGGLLALLGALFEKDIHAVSIRGGLTGYRSILNSPFLYVPHDAIVPGALTTGDLDELAAALAPRSLRVEELVDGLNRRVLAEHLARVWAPVRTAYRDAGAQDRLWIETEKRTDSAAQWLLRELKRP